jgi:hypothetical protein
LAQGVVSAIGNVITDGYFVGNFLGNVTGNFVVPGSNTQVVFNTNGNADAVGGFTYNKGANLLTVLGNINAQDNVLTPVVNLGATIATPIKGGSHDKIKLYDFNNANVINYAIGAEDHAVWFSVDDATAGFKFYNGNVANTRIGGNGTISTAGNVVANAITLKNTDDFAQIVFSSDGGATNNGQIKVDGGTNMVVASNNNFYVKRAGQDRIAITDTNSNFEAAANVVIQSNKSGSAQTLTFDTSGNLTGANNISATTYVTAPTTQTNTITSVNNNNDIYIDPQLSGMAFIQLPTFQDGGEQLVINNHFAYGNGIVLVTETGSFHFSGNSVTFPDGTTQSTAFTGTSNTFSAITMTSTPTGPSNQINYGLGNLVSWLDGGWTIGEYNGTDYGTEGIRINPGIEGPADIVLPADAANSAVSVNNYAGNVVIQTGNGHSWKFENSGSLVKPNAVVESTSNTTQCNTGVPTVVFSSQNQFIHTMKLIIQVEGQETTSTDTQACEMLVARSFRNNSVIGSVYGLTYTSNSPLATFNAAYNATTNQIDITCTPTSLTNPVFVRVAVTQMTSDL